MPRKKTHEEYVQQVRDLRGEEYCILSRYKGLKQKVKVLHTVCGETYETRADGLISGYMCKTCLYSGMKKRHEDYVEQVQKVFNGEYEVVGRYTGAHDLIDILHKECGSIRSVNANSVLQGKRCVDCYNKSRIKTQDDFEYDVYELVGDEYVVAGEYKMANEPVMFLHNDEKCNLTFKTTPNSFLSSGTRCPYCAYSKGEDNIRRVLEAKGLRFEAEKSFDGLINKRSLRFDFYIPDYNLCIEFDGEQHFKPVELFGGLTYLKQIQANDEKKTRYCLDNNINLLRIPYTELNREEYLIDEALHSLEYIMHYNKVGQLA